MKLPPLSHLLLPLALASAALVSACQGCRPGATLPAENKAPQGETPTVRLYFLSSVAGALEPCGCSKNQLGGVDHLGSFLKTHQAEAPHSLLAAAGPLFFLDPTPRGEQSTQDRWKAEALAAALGKLHFAAWAPGANDWAAGGANLAQLREKSGGALLAANLEGDTGGAAPTALRESGGVKVGFIGLSQPVKAGMAPAGVTVKPAAAQLAASVAQLKSQGAQVLVGLFAMPRGEALRLAEGAPELQVVAVGKPFDQGEANDKPAPPSLLGQTLVVETANHLQTAAVVDLHVRGGSFAFQDAAGIDRAADRDGIGKRIAELEARIRKWEQDSTINQADLTQRRAELVRLREELRQLEQPRPPAAGSFFRYTMLEIKTDLGRDDGIYLSMLDFYSKVNDYNKSTFADRKALPPGADGNRYVGAEVCGSCHAEAKKTWEGTAHAHAYKTLSDQHKEFNLDCVSCHVTGYDRPGGSTVTDNALLQNVQCENCHGPGEKHRQKPADKALIIGKPAPDSCVGACHHPPHVDGFDPVAQMHKILGPGHGHPDEWPPKKARLERAAKRMAGVSVAVGKRGSDVSGRVANPPVLSCNLVSSRAAGGGVAGGGVAGPREAGPRASAFRPGLPVDATPAHDHAPTPATPPPRPATPPRGPATPPPATPPPAAREETRLHDGYGRVANPPRHIAPPYSPPRHPATTPPAGPPSPCSASPSAACSERERTPELPSGALEITRRARGAWRRSA